MYKSKLQELCHQRAWDLPEYITVKDGPDHCPRFTSTVTVNGVTFESPQHQCKSSKEAQNLAAKIAFDHLAVPRPTPMATPAPPPPVAAASAFIASPSPLNLPSPGFVASVNNLDFRPAKNDTLQRKQGENDQTSLATGSSSGCRVDLGPKDVLHIYKNRLQHYAQKKSLGLPEYSCEFDGPPHARRFRASVTVDGKTYTSLEYFSTLKDAEHAIAKVAFESLTTGEIQEDEGLYKTLLQEFSQREGLRFPSYTTIRTGPFHMASFMSTVEIGGEIFQGQEFKTKKLSEMNAAKVAYNSLLQRRRSHNLSPDDNINGNIKVTSSSLQPVTTGGLQVDILANNVIEAHLQPAAGETGEIHKNPSVISPGSHKNEAVKVPSWGLDSVVSVTRDLQPDVQSKPVIAVNENAGEIKGEETNPKRYRYSAPPDKHYLSETSPPAYALLDGPSSYCASTEHSKHCLVESDSEYSARGCDATETKTTVFPRDSSMTIPEGASILPYSDEKWIAARMVVNQDQ